MTQYHLSQRCLPPCLDVLCCPQVHVATFTDASMMSAEEDSTSSPDDDPYDDTDILNSAGTDEVTAHLAAAGISWLVDYFVCNQHYNCNFF